MTGRMENIMRKIIENKVYDTETAKEIAYANNGYFSNDYDFAEETLYRKRTGEYFIHGHGNAMSKYGAIVARAAVGSEKIIPLSFSEAEEWAKNNLNAEEYENIFGEIVEDESCTVVGISLKKDVHEKAKRNAQKKSISVSAYISTLIENDN